ncbi:HNH endonuclease, partial [Mycobacterium sp. ITM-2017-0098]
MSVTDGIIEHMFDGSLPEPDELTHVSDAELATAVAGWAAASAAADARKLAAIAELARRACTDERRERQAIDGTAIA